MVVNPYLVFYRIIDDIVIIHRILHGRRDYTVNRIISNGKFY
ncbi:type II toxin-antitoxin system RelE/ParE family toxin [Paenibacillus sp. Soil522]